MSFVGTVISYLICNLVFLLINRLSSTIMSTAWEPNIVDVSTWQGGQENILASLLEENPLEYITFGLIVPVGLGWLVGRLTLSERVDTFLRWVNSDAFSLTPTAWDHCVYHREHDVRVEIHLVGGGQVSGYLGPGSAAAASADGGDIYVELREDGVFDDVKGGSGGVWVAGSAIQCIRFYDVEDDADLELGGYS